jgi:ADP-glucose pyrophosphorylase
LKQGEKISNLENALQNLIRLPLTICKRTLKKIYKRICKNKTFGASVVQNVKNKETIHAYLMSSFIGSIPSNLCTYIMQTSSIMHFYTCFGLCWHQSRKRGRLKGN